MSGAQQECPPLQQDLYATRPVWPYNHSQVCCGFVNRPFELMSREKCESMAESDHNIPQTIVFEWPNWESQFGCVRPPSKSVDFPDPPVCCYFTDKVHLRSVFETSMTQCTSTSDGFTAVAMPWCVSTKCFSGNVAENYPNGFRFPDGELWPSYGVSPRLPFNETSRLLLFMGVAVVCLILLTCCFFSLVLAFRMAFAHREHDPYALEVPTTALDTAIAEAELLPDIAALGEESAVASWLGCEHEGEGEQGGTTDVVFVVMPDESMHLGQGEEDTSPREAHTAVVCAHDKPSMLADSTIPPAATDTAARNGSSEGTPQSELENETERVCTLQQPTGAASSRLSTGDACSTLGRHSLEANLNGSCWSSGLHHSEVAEGFTAASAEDPAREQFMRSCGLADGAGIELSQMGHVQNEQQAASYGEAATADTGASPMEGAGTGSTSATGLHTEELFCKGESGSAQSDAPEQCEQAGASIVR